MHSHLTQCWRMFKPFHSPFKLRWLSHGMAIGVLSIALLASRHTPAGGQEQDANPSPQPTATPSSPVSNPRPLLQIGSQGTAVEELQALLKLLGFYDGSVDGLYQPSTAAAVTAFQTAAGLPADGIVGPATWNRLLPPSPSVVNGASVSAHPSHSATTAPVSTLTASSATTAPATTAPTAARPAPSGSSPASPVRSPSPSPTATSSTPAQPSTPSPHSTPVPPTEQPALIDFPVLRLGVRGPAVSRLQQRLRAAGFFSGAVDGVFGPETQSAVKAAQRHYGLNPDGIVGPATWTALMQ